jgi:hypothetical protein
MGWIYATGQSPKGKTGRVKAGSTGTTMMVQHEGPSDGGTHRVFLLEKSTADDKVNVVLDNKPATEKKLEAVDTYFEIGPTHVDIPAEKPLPEAPDAVRALVDYAKAIAQNSLP